MTWWEVLENPECPTCGASKSRIVRGPLCQRCMNVLPGRLRLHLERAVKGCHFILWWRVACSILRRRAIR